MSKRVDWENLYKGTLRGLRSPKGAAYTSRKEQVAQAYFRMEQQEKAQADFAKLEPILKKSLLAHMVSRTPIRVERPMSYLTEELRKAQPMDEIDRAFYRQDKQSENPGQFEVISKAIEPGTELVFQGINQALGQWIFKSSNGDLIEIYDKPVVSISAERAVQNPGFWGLLTCTNIYSDAVGNPDAEE